MHGGRHGRVGGVDAGLAGDQTQRRVEAGGASGGEELFGVRRPAGPAEFLRHEDRQIDDPVVGGDVTVAAVTGGMDRGAVERCHDHNCTRATVAHPHRLRAVMSASRRLSELGSDMGDVGTGPVRVLSLSNFLNKRSSWCYCAVTARGRADPGRLQPTVESDYALLHRRSRGRHIAGYRVARTHVNRRYRALSNRQSRTRRSRRYPARLSDSRKNRSSSGAIAAASTM